ncbi:MAG: ATP-binding protein [Acidimicrobiales bacterium]
MRLALRYIEDGLALTRHDAWAWFAVPTRSYDLLSDQQRLVEARSLALALASLRDAECHLIVAHQPFEPMAWAAHLDETTPHSRPGWESYLSHLEQHLHGEAYAERRVYLGVRLGDRRQGWRPRKRQVEELVGVESPRISKRELSRWRSEAELIRRTLSGAGLRPISATTDELRWLVQRSFHRGLASSPLLPAPTSWGGALQTLAEGTVHNGRHTLRLEQPSGERHLAFLTVARMPERLMFPGQEWLYHTDVLGADIDISVRFKVVPARLAAAAASRKLVEAQDQARNIGGGLGEMPLGLAEMAESARELEHALTRDGLPLVYTQTALCVAAASAEHLETSVVDCIELYRDLGIELARPTGDQLALFVQALPGERWRLRAYEQRMPPITLAGGMPQATIAIGDGAGPYVGHTTGRSRAPVCFDPLWAAQHNEPTAVAITGAPGGGKTTLAQLLTYQMALRGAWVLVIDPKGDSAGLAGLPGLGRSKVLRLGAHHAGLLDPFRVATTPQEAAVLAADTCRLLLPPGLTADQEAALVSTCRAVANEDRRSLSRVLAALRTSDAPEAQRLAATLEAYTDLAVASLCFAPDVVRTGEPDDSGSLDLAEGVTVFTFAGLTFPAQGTPRNEYTLTDRLAVAVLHLVTALAARLADATRAQAKAIVLDEAWAVTTSAQGRALVQRLARTGRSKNLAMLLISQNAGDFLDETVSNCFSAKFAFRSTHQDEVRAVLKLVGLDDTQEHAAVVRYLGNGECIVSDVAGRVGTARVDLVLAQLAEAFDTRPQHALADVEVTS